MRKKTIVYTGLFQFPYGQAASKRVLGNVILLQSLGYEVIVGHGGDIEREDFQNDITSVKCYGLGELFSDKNQIVKLLSHLFLSGDRTLAWLEAMKEKPDYIIVYGGFYRYANKILKYCKKNNIKIIFDVVEWYEPAQMLGGRFGFFYNSFLLAFKYVYPRADGIISISSNLEKIFAEKSTVIIPPLAAIKMVEPFCNKSNLLSLIYAGNIGNKDNLYEIIQVVQQLSLKNEIRLDIFGISEAEIKLKYNVVELGSNIYIHGKVKQEEINNFIVKADFTIFTRPDTHCNRYGFPSKFVESLSLGVPVATNLTSDLGFYLLDGYNGFVISDDSKESIETVIRKMLLLSPTQKMVMKKNAIKTAEDNLSSLSLSLKENVSEFLTDIYEK